MKEFFLCVKQTGALRHFLDDFFLFHIHTCTSDMRRISRLNSHQLYALVGRADAIT